jgi:nitrate reductase gamma subunit
MWSLKRWFFVIGATVLGMGVTQGVFSRMDLLLGQGIGALFGVASFWLLERIVHNAVQHEPENKAKLIRLLLLKTLLLGALIGVLASMKSIHPVGFLVGYGCVLASWALENWISYPDKK